MKYKYILFDWDGCLAKTLDVWLKAYKQTLSELGINKTDKEIAAVFGSWQGGSELGAPDNDKFFERVDELVKTSMPKVALYEGVREVLRKLRTKGLKIAVLSSSLKDYLLQAMKHRKIYQYFEVVISGEDVKKHKPHPEVINKAIKKLGGKKGDYVLVGDSYKDILAAKRAGIDSVLFFPKNHRLYYNLEELLKCEPTHLAGSLKQVYRIIEEV